MSALAVMTGNSVSDILQHVLETQLWEGGIAEVFNDYIN